MVKVFFCEGICMDKKNLSILGIGVLAASHLLGGLMNKKPRDEEVVRAEQNMDYIAPGIALNEFISPHYKVSFKYPRGWSKNPRYEDKYEGESGFFEVGDFSGVGENIDEAVNEQINELYKPYGSNPTVRKFVVDGQPARVIYPSSDQTEFYKDREAAIVVKYPEPITIGEKTFDYVVIWASKDYVPLIMSTLKFLK